MYNATFALYGQKNGVTHFLCTATAFEQGVNWYHLLSAGHCVKGVPEGVTFAVSEQVGGELMPVTVVKAIRQKDIDFSVFTLETKKKYPVIPLSEDTGVGMEDSTFTVHFTDGIVKQVSVGKIASGIMGHSEDCEICPNRFMVQLYAGRGASGAAVVSAKTHKIIGLMVGGFSENIGGAVEPISLYETFLSTLEESPAVKKEDSEQ